METVMWKAIAIGVVSAVVLGFLLAAGYGAVFGARVPWGDVQMGSAGAGNAVNNLMFPPILLAVAGIGALIGAGVGCFRQGAHSLAARRCQISGMQRASLIGHKRRPGR